MLAMVLTGVVVVNLPFGAWRAATRKFSAAWFAAVHLPVPLVIGMRWLSGIGWHWRTFPLFLLAYFCGQLLGARLRGR